MRSSAHLSCEMMLPMETLALEETVLNLDYAIEDVFTRKELR